VTLANELLAAGDAPTNQAWRLPLWEEYQSLLDSKNFADYGQTSADVPLGNHPPPGPASWPATPKNYRWAHPGQSPVLAWAFPAKPKALQAGPGPAVEYLDVPCRQLSACCAYCGNRQPLLPVLRPPEAGGRKIKTSATGSLSCRQRTPPPHANLHAAKTGQKTKLAARGSVGHCVRLPSNTLRNLGRPAVELQPGLPSFPTGRDFPKPNTPCKTPWHPAAPARPPEDWDYRFILSALNYRLTPINFKRLADSSEMIRWFGSGRAHFKTLRAWGSRRGWHVINGSGII